MAAPLLVLGPQRPSPNLRPHLDRCAPSGEVALITAGWRHDEDEVGPLLAHLDRPVRHLRLYAEMDAILRSDPSLAAAYRRRQDDILAYKEVYRISLHAALRAVRDLRRSSVKDAELYGPDLDDAYDALRRIDSRLLKRLQAVAEKHAQVQEALAQHGAVQEVRARLLETMEGIGALLIAGGHVAVLRNRIRFFGLNEDILALPGMGVPVVSWSAGAMVLTERVVLFYDDPPHGHGEAEVLGRGFGLLPGVVLLPHARLRLDLSDQERVAMMAGRFLPHQCIGLESGAALEYSPDTGDWTAHSQDGGALRLAVDGSIFPGGPS